MATRMKIVTPEFRLSFPAVWEPKAGPDGGEEKYRIVMLFPKTEDIKALKKLAYDAIAEKWGADKGKWPANLRNLDLGKFLSTSGKDGWPFRDGDAQSLDGYAGCVSVSATSKQAPGVVDRKLKPIIDKDELYAGCYCRASVTAFAYDKAGNKGVSFGLQNIQKIRDGESFSGRSRAEDDFDAIAGDDDTASWDDPGNYDDSKSDEMFA